MQRPSPLVPAQQDHGTYLDISTDPQPLGPWGPMVQSHPMTVEIQGVDLILSAVPKMNKHEVPSYYGPLANNTTNGLRSGSIMFGKNPTCQPTNKLDRSHCRAGSVSARLVL